MSTEPTQAKESVFIRVPQHIAQAIRDAIDRENEERARKGRKPLFMRASRHNFIRWIVRAGARELRRAERGPRGRQVAAPASEKKRDPVTIARSVEIDAATADRVRAAVAAINGRRALLGKGPVCVHGGAPSLPAFYLRSAERELRRLERKTTSRPFDIDDSRVSEGG